MLYELILINEIEQRAKIIFFSVGGGGGGGVDTIETNGYQQLFGYQHSWKYILFCST